MFLAANYISEASMIKTSGFLKSGNMRDEVIMILSFRSLLLHIPHEAFSALNQGNKL